MVNLKADFLHIGMFPLQVKQVRRKDFILKHKRRDVQAHWHFEGVVAVVGEHKAIVDEEEFVGAVSVAVKHLVPLLVILSILVHKRKVSIFELFFILTPVKFFACIS